MGRGTGGSDRARNAGGSTGTGNRTDLVRAVDRKPLQCSPYVTDRCNLDCAYYTEYDNSWPHPSLDEQKKWIREIVARAKRVPSMLSPSSSSRDARAPTEESSLHRYREYLLARPGLNELFLPKDGSKQFDA